MINNYILKLNLIVSDHFFSHERNNLIKQINKKLNIKNRFELGVCRSHTKITLIETKQNNGRKFVFHGSANLRSSDNIEQFMIEENEDLYDFNYNHHKEIINKYSVSNYKAIRSNALF